MPTFDHLSLDLGINGHMLAHYLFPMDLQNCTLFDRFKWITASQKERRQIPYAAWRQLLEFTGLVCIGGVHVIFESHTR